jgi:hypothetical protein
MTRRSQTYLDGIPRANYITTCGAVTEIQAFVKIGPGRIGRIPDIGGATRESG